MARKLEDQVNVEAPDSDYPYGRIRDDQGIGNGTPLTEAVHGDYHQFFARILAESGVVANDLPDNEYTGFQYYEGLLGVITKRISRYSAGDSVAVGLSDNFNEFILAGVYKVTGAFSNKPTGFLANGLLLVTGSGNDIIQKVTDVGNGAEWARAYTGSWSAWTLIRLAEKKVDIGDWDMDANFSTTVAHGLTLAQIHTIKCSIRNDADSAHYTLPAFNVIDASTQVWVSATDATDILIVRLNAGPFDSTSFDSTSYNRGYVVIEYFPA